MDYVVLGTCSRIMVAYGHAGQGHAGNQKNAPGKCLNAIFNRRLVEKKPLNRSIS